MNSLDYYYNKFPYDLENVYSSVSRSISDRRLSIVSLLPLEKNSPTNFRNNYVFDKIQNQWLFLFCYFFSSLIDQSIHSALRSEHPFFDKIANYPKFVGILHTGWSNINPAFLLLIATLYVPTIDKEKSTNQFYLLADYFSDDYCKFFETEYPKLTGRLKKTEDRIEAIKAVLSELRDAINWISVPKKFYAYSNIEPDLDLYEKWIQYFSQKIRKKNDIYNKISGDRK